MGEGGCYALAKLDVANNINVDISGVWQVLPGFLGSTSDDVSLRLKPAVHVCLPSSSHPCILFEWTRCTSRPPDFVTNAASKWKCLGISGSVYFPHRASKSTEVKASLSWVYQRQISRPNIFKTRRRRNAPVIAVSPFAPYHLIYMAYKVSLDFWPIPTWKDSGY